MEHQDTIKEILCLIYNSGYKAGHHQTVEGGYTDVHHNDYFEYHKEEVLEILKEYELEGILE